MWSYLTHASSPRSGALVRVQRLELRPIELLADQSHPGRAQHGQLLPDFRWIGLAVQECVGPDGRSIRVSELAQVRRAVRHAAI